MQVEFCSYGPSRTGNPLLSRDIILYSYFYIGYTGISICVKLSQSREIPWSEVPLYNFVIKVPENLILFDCIPKK